MPAFQRFSSTSAPLVAPTFVEGVDAITERDFAKAYKEHKPAVFSFARRLARCHEDAEEITNDAFMRLWQSDAVIDDERKFLMTCADRAATSFYRSSANRYDWQNPDAEAYDDNRCYE